MKWITTISIFFLFISFADHPVFGQSQPITDKYRDLMTVTASPREFSTRIDPANELKLILTSAFAFYKHFISSQDAVHCAFYPSCSVYALETIQTNGLLGIFDAIDRLTRCNSLSPEKYKLHESSQRFYDPVRHMH